MFWKLRLRFLHRRSAAFAPEITLTRLLQFGEGNGSPSTGLGFQMSWSSGSLAWSSHSANWLLDHL